MSTTTKVPQFDGITALLLLILLMLCLFGCVTQKKCNEKFPPVLEVHHNHEKETIIKDSILPGATIVNTIYRDSLVIMPVNKWTYIKDTSGLAQLRYYKDAYGNLQVECEANSRAIQKMLEKQRESSETVKTEVVHDTRVPVWVWLAFGVLGSIILGLLFRKFLRGIIPVITF